MYDQKRPPEDAWCRLLQELNPKHLTDLAFHWPAPGQDPASRWRPTWAQLYQSGPPYTRSFEYSPRELLCLTPPQHPSTAADCWHYAYVIENCYLNLNPDNSVSMYVPLGSLDQVKVVDSFKIVPQAGGQFQFQNTYYAAVGVADQSCWILGKANGPYRRDDEWYIFIEKIAVFSMTSQDERDRLWHLNPGYADMKVFYK